MSKQVSGVVAGLAATGALSALMFMKSMLGLMPQLDIIAMLSDMTGTSSTGGWIAHFTIGAMFGGLFAMLYSHIPGDNAVIKGIVFALVAWVLMMFVVMPMAGAGFFGRSLGIMVPMMTLMLHVVFGAILGFTYSRPATSPAHSV